MRNDELPEMAKMKKSRVVSRVAIGLAIALLIACSQSQTQKLVLTGSSTVAPLAAEIGKQYEREHPKVRIDVQTGGSSRGIADARQKVADIGMVSRALKPEERDLMAFTIAWDGISIILHQKNPVTELKREEIIGIYTGKINNWKEVGGEDAPITVVNKAEGRSTLELFAQYFQLPTADMQADVVIGDNEQGIKTVVGNPNAIGYVSIGSAEYSAVSGNPIKLLPIAGVAPSTTAVKKGKFPLARPLNFVTMEKPQGLAKDFIEFARSPQVKQIIEEQYFVYISK